MLLFEGTGGEEDFGETRVANGSVEVGIVVGLIACGDEDEASSLVVADWNCAMMAEMATSRYQSITLVVTAATMRISAQSGRIFRHYTRGKGASTRGCWTQATLDEKRKRCDILAKK